MDNSVSLFTSSSDLISDHFSSNFTIVSLSLLSGNVNMTNLFKNNEELGQSTLKVLNDEWETLDQAVRPKIMSAISDLFRKVVQSVLDTIPFDDMYSKDSL